MLENIRIVLVRTYHPGNIGSAARSMKTMGLSDLCLVNPRDFPAAEAEKMAAGATDVVANATLKNSLTDALADCTVVIASTARPRGYDLPELDPETAAEMLTVAAQHGPVALIFGPERMGLHNDDIQHAKYRVTIPANPAYSSLNMAAAVQTLSYEIYKRHHAKLIQTSSDSVRSLPTSAQVELLFEHMEQVLKKVEFLRPHQGETMQRIRHLITRAEPDSLEMNILRGILTAIEKQLARLPNK